MSCLYVGGLNPHLRPLYTFPVVEVLPLEVSNPVVMDFGVDAHREQVETP